MQEQQDDNMLIQLVLSGQQAAYSILVNRHQSYVFTLVLRYVKEREVAEELSQDVFVKAYRYLADFRGKSKFSTWLYTIVNTTCLSYLRKGENDILLLEEDKIIHITDRQTSENPATKLEQKASNAILARAMKLLPNEQARILDLFYIAEQSIDEIGLIMGLTTTNVKVKLYRARGKLKEILDTKFSAEFSDR
jgi:RNA polymerase sigma-70 factor (ECF subfamily)